MSKSCVRLIAVLFISVCVLLPRIAAADDSKPVRAEEVLALIAGNALPENIVREINQSGLAFTPDDSYGAQLKDIGADASVIAAVNGAKIVTGEKAETIPEKALLQHYVDAAIKMKAKDYHGASGELTAVIKSSFEEADAGFAMGEVLRLQGKYTEASAIFHGVLTIDHDYPEALTKLSYIEARRLEDGNEALKLANAAIAVNKDDPEAHKNAGLGLYMLGKGDAAEAEFQQALRLKPGYAAAIIGLGWDYEMEKQYKLAIAQYKKAETITPDDGLLYSALGVAYDDNGDIPSAMAAYRQALKLNSHLSVPRRNLGSDLQHARLDKEAVAEFRTLMEQNPDSPYCHDCFGTALYRAWDFAGAEKEFRMAMTMDPIDPAPHLGIALIREEQKRYGEAIQEYEITEKLNPDSVDAARGAGRTYLAEKQFPLATAELKRAEENSPADANVHDLYAQALLGENKQPEAIQEFKESLSLDSKQSQVALRLARAYEANGDWAEAIHLYQKTAAEEASLDYRKRVVRTTDLDPQQQYKDAQKRFDDHIAALKAAGRNGEAAELQASIRSSADNASLSDKLNSLMQAGTEAAQQRRYDEALRSYQQAVAVADQMQPHDQRLVTALDHLGNLNMGQNFPAADVAFERELAVAQELYGPQSSDLEGPLQSLGTSALLQKDYVTAEKFYFRAVDLDEKAYGESSDKVASSLVMATRVYFVQKQYEKAEPYLLRAEHLDEAIYGVNDPQIMRPLWTLCVAYDQGNQPDKAEPCYAHSLAVGENQFGAKSPELISILTADSAQLRKLGKNAEAGKIEARAASLRSATMASN